MINRIINIKETPCIKKTSIFSRIVKTYRFLLLAIFLSLFTFSKKIYFDMGMIHATDATVSEESQKAIIFHNGLEEVLILGTDLKASKNTGVIRFIPFPSEPSVRLAPNSSFETINTLISDHGLKFISYSKGGPGFQEAVELRFNEKLGAHDITVIKINDASQFRNWVNAFFKKKGLPQRKEYPEIEHIVDDYIKRGIAWFVFDFVEIDEKVKFIEPVEYRFKTKELYYPLKTSNTVGGTGDVNLIIIAPGTLGRPFEPIPNCLGIMNMKASTSSKIERAELKEILPDADTFFANKKVFIQVLQYKGKYEFEKDIFANLSNAKSLALWDWGQLDGYRENYPSFYFDDKPFYTYQTFSPPGNYFSLKIPNEWKISEYDLVKEYDQYELILHAPGFEIMDYLNVSAIYYADEHKTCERFLYDLENPESKIPGEDYGSVYDITIAGKKAKVLDIKTYRYPLPGMGGKRTESLKRYVLIPARTGFFVLLFDSPAESARKFIPVFNDILNSFIMSVKTTYHPALREITADDYSVYTDFFSGEKLNDIDFPQYFENVLQETKVAGKTLVNRKPYQSTMKNLKQLFGDGVESVFASYQQKNAAEYMIKDRILLNGLSIYSEKELNDGKWMGLPSERIKSILYFSKVGFNKEKTLALFYVSNSGAPNTSYFVYMEKKENKWLIRNAVLDKLIIY